MSKQATNAYEGYKALLDIPRIDRVVKGVHALAPFIERKLNISKTAATSAASLLTGVNLVSTTSHGRGNRRGVITIIDPNLRPTQDQFILFGRGKRLNQVGDIPKADQPADDTEQPGEGGDQIAEETHPPQGEDEGDDAERLSPEEMRDLILFICPQLAEKIDKLEAQAAEDAATIQGLRREVQQLKDEIARLNERGNPVLVKLLRTLRDLRGTPSSD